MNAKIKFDGPVEGTKFGSQNLGFQGRGSIAVGTDAVVFSGKQRRFFSLGRKATAELKSDEILNVERSDKQIRFALQSADAEKSSKVFSFSAQTDQEAERIESLLPKVQTADFAQAKGEHRDFNARLCAATPHAFMVPAIVLSNVLVFIVMAVAGAGVIALDTDAPIQFLTVNPEVHVKWGANFGPLTTDGQWWRLLTSTFLHFGILHLLFNMWALYAAGKLVERLYGNAFFLILFLTAGVTGSVASVLWNPNVLSAGASGAIFGVYGGLLAYLLLQRKSVPPSVVTQLRNSAVAFAAYNLLYGFGHSGIDHAAHLGGLVGGAVVGLSLARPLDVDVRKKTAWYRLLAGLSVAALLLTIMLLPVQNSGKEYRQEQRFQADLRWFSNEEKSIVSQCKEVNDKIRAGLLREDQSVSMLEPTVAQWEKAYEKLSGVELDDQAPSGRRSKLLLKYVELRRDAMKALVQGLKTESRAKLDEFHSLEAMAQKVVEEIKDGKKSP